MDNRLRKMLAKKAVIASELKLVNSEISGDFKMIAKELGYTRKEYEAHMERLDMTEAEYLAAENKRRLIDTAGGLIPEEQLEMFQKVKDTADELAEARRNGRRAAFRTEDRIPPKHLHPSFHQEWIGGWDEATEEINQSFITGQKILDERKAMPALAADPNPPKDDEAKAEGETPADDDEAAIKAKADKLQAEGWTETRQEETSFAEPKDD